MSTEQNKEERIYSEAISKTPQERQAYIEKACGNDKALLERIKALLKSREEAGSFLDGAYFDEDVTLDQSPLPEVPGTIIGRYKLLEKIGEGGMASVYMAEQKQPIRRRVALKIIKLGMDTKQVIARFEAERQALAMMDHPNIAQVFDAGTTETGRPYFVMELVRGVPITEFCDKNHLNMQERLELFISVCNAVQHAHQKGIIHRDIKPSNIMVTLHDGQPVVKVIDFGIAKAVNQQLTEKTVFTRYAQMIGTPEYMSPEQAEMSGLDIDTRTDVFSLGVLLYELMTGTTPFDSEYLLKKGYGEMQRIIREEEPLRPSTKISTLGDTLTAIAKQRHTSPEILRRLIRIDLDWIVMKTLEKDRQRRYESVSELAADIKRHLKHEPVLAGRPSRIYKIQKFYKRNKTLCVFSATIAVIVILASIIASQQAWVAQKARKAESIARRSAEKDRDRAQQAEEAERKQRNEADMAKEEAVKQKTIAESERDQAEKAKLLAEEETERARKAQDLAERLAYKGTVQTALTKIESENYTGLRELLFGTEINRRGWEWGYLANMCQIPDWELRIGAGIFYLSTSSDGQQFCTSIAGSAVCTWDSDTHQLLRAYRVDPGSCHYDPQGHFIAALSMVASRYSGKIVKLDINSDKILRTSDTSDYSTFCISPNGEYIYAGTNSGEIHKLRSIDLTIDERTFKQLDPITSLNIDESGTLLGIVCETCKLYLYKASTLELIAEKGQLPEKGGDKYKEIVISSSLDKIFVLSFGSLFTNTLDPNNNDLRSWSLHGGRGYAMSLNKDHTKLAVSEWEGNIHLIDTQNMEILYTIYNSEQISNVSYLPNEKIITGGASGIKCWSRFEFPDETPKKEIEFPKDTVAWNLDYRSDGRIIAFNVWNFNGLFLYDTEKKEYKELIVEGIEKDLVNYGRPVTLFRSGTTQLIVESNNILHVYDTGIDGNPEINRIQPSHPVIHGAFSPNGKYLALSYEDGIIGLIDFEKGMSSERVFHESGQENGFVNISVNGVLAALEKGTMKSGDFGRIFLWDIYTGRLLRVIDTRNSRFLWEYWEIQGITFDPSGRYLAFGNLGGGIEIWDTHTGKRFKNLTGHLSNLVSSVQFSQDGSRLLSAGRDGTIRVWDWLLGQELIVLRMDCRLSDVQFSPNELYLCATGYETSTGCTIQTASWRLNARQPQPANKAILNIAVNSRLNWLAGMNATNHNVYFGDSENAVRNATTDSPEYKGSFKFGNENYSPIKLRPNTSYYWRIDEVNSTKPDMVWKGNVWSFSTVCNVIIDDFEGYNNSESFTVRNTWHDDREKGENGSRIGYEATPFCEETIVQNGRQSAPLFYDNSRTMNHSEAVRTYNSPQNWTEDGADSLRLYYRGQAIKSFKEISPGVIAMSGEGTDIWENKDDFHFAYKQLSGDGSIVARVDSLERYQQYTKTGVMIRASLDPTSIHVISDIHSNGRTALQYREKWDDITYQIISGTEGINLPVWLKLSRKGNTFTSERSVDGVHWEPIDDSIEPATIDIFMGNPVYIGLAVCSSMKNKTSAATFSGVEITGNVSGDWQIANIGDEIQPEGTNTLDKLYVALEDSSGHRQSVYASEIAVVTCDWVEWIIPYNKFSGVDMSSIKKIAIGVGDPDNPLKGKGLIYIDNISYGCGLKGYQSTPE